MQNKEPSIKSTTNLNSLYRKDSRSVSLKKSPLLSKLTYVSLCPSLLFRPPPAPRAGPLAAITVAACKSRISLAPREKKNSVNSSTETGGLACCVVASLHSIHSTGIFTRAYDVCSLLLFATFNQ